jgi:putative nucleotidyltransferase-like protein
MTRMSLDTTRDEAALRARSRPEEPKSATEEPIGAGFGPELTLVLACARWPLDAAGRTEIARRAAAVRDWQRFLDWVGRHGVAPLVCANLRAAGLDLVPGELFRALEDRERGNRLRVFGQIAEAARVTRVLADAGIRAMMVKGPPLAALAFDDVTLRWSRDIDLLIDPAHVEEADRLLIAAGYRRFAPDFALTKPQQQLFLKMRCEFAYYHEPSDVILELHWRLTSNRRLMPLHEYAVWGHAKSVRVGGATFSTLSDDELLLYLCVHGAIHVWFRLKWLADVAALLRQMPEEVLERAASRAAALGLERILHQSLLLAHALFAAPVPPPLLAAASRDRAARRLARAACRAINWRESPGEPARTPWFNLWVSGQAFRLKSGLSYRWAEFQDQICSPEDWQRLPLPRSLAFLYPPFRPISWLARKLTEVFAR